MECDSYRWPRRRSAWARDRRKDRHCEERHIELIRLIAEDLHGDGPVCLAARLAV